MAWIYLGLAICSEVTATTFLKLSEGFSRLVPSVIVVVGYVIAFWFLSLALKTFDVGVAYTIWAGTGTALVALIGWLFLNEHIAWPVWVGIGLVIGGVVLVEAFSGAQG